MSVREVLFWRASMLILFFVGRGLAEKTTSSSGNAATADTTMRPRPTSRYAIGFYGMLRSYAMEELRSNINATILAPNEADGGIDVYWHIYADEEDDAQREALEFIRADPRTAALVVEPWGINRGESSSWQESFPTGPGLPSRKEHAWESVEAPSWLIKDMKRRHPLLAQGKAYIKVGAHEMGILSHWRKVELVANLIRQGHAQLKAGERSAPSPGYAAAALSRSDVLYAVADGSPVHTLFRHFEVDESEGAVVIIPEKGDWEGGIHDWFVAGSVRAVWRYARLYSMLPSLVSLPEEPRKESTLERGEEKARYYKELTKETLDYEWRDEKKANKAALPNSQPNSIRRFHSETLLYGHLVRQKLRIARIPLMSTVIRTDQFMKKTSGHGDHFSPSSIAHVLATDGFPAMCKQLDVWHRATGPRTECPKCCSADEIAQALKTISSSLGTTTSTKNASASSETIASCWGRTVGRRFSYVGVQEQALARDEYGSTDPPPCTCTSGLQCDLCAPIAKATTYRCNISPRGSICTHSNFNHLPAPQLSQCPRSTVTLALPSSNRTSLPNNSSTCGYVENVDYRGRESDFVTGVAEDVSKCCAACTAREECNFFTYDPGKTLCYLQRHKGFEVPAKGFISGYKTEKTLETPPDTEECSFDGSVDFRGSDIMSVEARDAADCCAKCRSYAGLMSQHFGKHFALQDKSRLRAAGQEHTKSCSFFTYDTRQRMCFLKSSRGAVLPSTDAMVSGQAHAAKIKPPPGPHR